MHKFRKLIALLGVVAIASTLVVSTATAAEWYEPYVENLSSVGVDFSDVGANTTRCEWAMGVVQWNGLMSDTPAEPTFLDVPKTHECYEYIETAYAHGVVGGYTDADGDPTGYFGPSDLVTREQAGKMIVEGEGLPLVEDSGIFPDESSLSDWFTDAYYHSTVYAWNKMVGDSTTGMFRGGDNINHAEAAKVITIEAELSAGYVEDEEEVPDEVVSEGDLLVELSEDTPAGDTVPDKATSVEVAKWDFTATGGDVVVDVVKVHTHGVTSLPSGHALYLYNGGDRLTSGKSVNSSTNLATFTNLNLVIDDGETVTLTLKVDIGDASATSEMGFELEMAEHIDASGAVVDGDFPLQGETFGISTTEAGTVTIEKNGTITNPKVGEDDVVIAKFKISAATEAAELNQLGLLVTGTISNDAVENFELYVSGETDPLATVANLNSKDLAVFVLDTPYTITKGDTKAFTMKADFNTGRTDDTVKVYVDETTDVLAIGGTYGFGMSVSITASYDAVDTACTSTAGDCSYSVLEGGDITITSSGPAATDIGTAADDVPLLNFSIAAVSSVTFKNFPINLTGSESGAAQGLLSAADVANFTDIKVTNVDTNETLLGPIDADVLTTALAGSTVITDSSGDNAISYYLFTDEFTMETGEELNLSLTADVANIAGLNGMTLVAGLSLGASYPEIRDVNNKTMTNTSSLVPASAITGKTMTVGAPSLTLSLAAVPVTTTRVKGENGVKFTGISAKCGSASSCKVTDVLLQGYLDDTGGSDADPWNPNDWTTDGIGDDNATYLNEYVGSVWLENSAEEIIAAAQSVESDGDVQFNNMSWQLDAGETAIFYAVGDISSDAYKDSDGEAIAFGVETAGDVDYEDDDGNTRDSTGTPNSEGDGTTDPSTYVMVSNGGSITVAVDASTPNEDIVVAATADQEISAFKFTTTDEAFIVKALSVNARQANAGTIADIDDADLGAYDNNISSITISYPNSDGDTETKTGYLTDGTAQFSGMDFYIDKDDDAILTISATLSSIALGEATAGEYVDLNLAFNNFESVAQSSGETYKADKLDATYAAGSDLDFGTITYIDNGATFEVDDADFAATGPTLATSISLTIDNGAGGADPGLILPVGTMLCIDEANNNTSCAENLTIVTAYTDGANDDTYTLYVVDDAGGAFADDSDIAWALPGTGYLTNAKQMHVYKSVPVLALASSSPSGSRTVNQDDTIFEFTITPDSADDVIIRQGIEVVDDTDATADATNVADADVTITTTSGEYVDGTGGIQYEDLDGDAADGDCFSFTDTLTGHLDDYKYVSFWIATDQANMPYDQLELGVNVESDCNTTPTMITYLNDTTSADDDGDTDNATNAVWINGVEVSNDDIYIGGGTANQWDLVTVDLTAGATGAVAADVYIAIFATAEAAELDQDEEVYIDGVVLHNEMLVVDLASNARFDTTPSNGGDGDSIVQCELYEGTTIKATAGAGVASTSAAKILFVPQDHDSGTDYPDIEIPKGVSTKYSVVCDTMDLITPSVNDDLLTPSIDFGSSTNGSVTEGDFWWSADESTKTLVYWLGDVGIKLSGNTLKY